MRIRSIKFAKTVSTENGSERIEVFSEVGPKDRPEEVFEKTKKFVEIRLGTRTENDDFEYKPFGELVRKKDN